MLNKIILMGRLTKDIELKKTQNGVSVCIFSVAVERNYTQNGNRETDFINCTAWRGTAEFISRYFSKGSLLALEGTLQSRTYSDRDGSSRKTYEVIAEQVYFAGDKARTAEKPEQAEAPVQYSNGDNADFSPIEDMGDLPF